jgi:hypothetical protein
MDRLFKLMCIFLLVVWCNNFSFAADEESIGRQAETAGNLREALTHYVEALKSVPLNQQLRERIIKLAQQIKPPPAIPEAAERHMLRGEAAVETAKDKTGYENAANEFNAAILIAPWLATGYFNLSVVQEKAGNYEEAIRNVRLYLLAAPDAADAPDMRKRIVKLEYKLEQMKDQREAETRKKQDVEALSGNWKAKELTNAPWVEKQPSFSSDWQGIVTDAYVTVTGDRIDIRVGEERFAGTIHGTSLKGRWDGGLDTMRKEYHSTDFKGEISLDGKMILLIVRGSWGMKWSKSARALVPVDNPAAFPHSRLLVRP